MVSFAPQNNFVSLCFYCQLSLKQITKKSHDYNQNNETLVTGTGYVYRLALELTKDIGKLDSSLPIVCQSRSVFGCQVCLISLLGTPTSFCSCLYNTELCISRKRMSCTKLFAYTYRKITKRSGYFSGSENAGGGEHSTFFFRIGVCGPNFSEVWGLRTDICL